MEWEAGLPNVDDLPPLSHLLISPELASAFNITPDPPRSMTDVTRASLKTLSTLQGQHVLDKLTDFTSSSTDEREDHETVVEGDESFTRTSKRVRLVWTPQLHKRFVEVVKHLGVKKAVPKTIMQLMNVEGLTRENVASHLQKYRLYVKRKPGLASELDRPVVVSRKQNQHALGPISMPYMVPMITYPSPHMVHHHGFEYHSHPYNFGLVSCYQQGVATNDR